MQHIQRPSAATADKQLSQRRCVSSQGVRPPVRLRAAVAHASKKSSSSSSSSSPWSTGSASNKRSASSGSKNKSSSSKKSSKAAKTASSKSASKNNTTSSSNGSGVVSSTCSSSPPATDASPPLHQLTPPLTPQLLDTLSPCELTAAPLWSTFTGHCEGEWLGQYAAYTPWAGDPEPVWADESGAQLLFAYSRTSEDRQIIKVSSSTGSSSSSSSGDGTTGSETMAAAAAVEGSSGDAAGLSSSFDEMDLLVRSTVRSASISSLIGGMSAAAAALGSEGNTATSAGAAAADDEKEFIAYNQGGVVVFNGGSYSMGPEVIEAPEVDEEDWAAAAAAAAGGDDQDGTSDPDQYQQQQEELYSSLPFSTVVIEQCLVSSGDSRLRLVVTLKLRQPPEDQEVDVEVARLLLYKEHWYGTAASTSGNINRRNRLLDRQSDAPAATALSSSSSNVLSLLPSHQFDVPVTSLNRPQPQQLAGSWNVFLVTANPITEENPDTLQSEQVWVYTSTEERQQWHVPGITSSAALGSSSSNTGSSAAETASADVPVDDSDGSGGSFWLPGGAVVTLKMVDIAAAATVASSSSGPPAGNNWSGSPESNGNGQAANTSSSSSGTGRGLLVGLHWLLADGSCEFVERQYAADGVLVEVRHGSAVLGGWCGGRG